MLDSGPALGGKVTYNGKEYTIVKEGLAEILEPVNKIKPQSGSSAEVFYNPIQQFNRDLSVLAIRVFAEDFALIKKQKSQHFKGFRRFKKSAQGPQEGYGVPLDENGGPERLKDEQDPDTSLPSTTKRKRTDINGGELPGEVKRTKVTDTSDLEESTNSNGLSTGLGPTGSNNADTVPSAPRAQLRQQFRILDALSATGLRALRYSKEIDHVTLVTANDLSPTAVEAINLNVRHNGMLGKVHPIVGDANAHMYSMGSHCTPTLPDGTRGKYHVIDLDPYGTASPFLDAAVQALQDGGLLCVTCTDSAIFASTGYLEKTFAQYGGLPIKGFHSHEGGLRLALQAIATSAARYGLAIEPLLSLSIDFYIRLFVRVRKSAHEVKLLPGKTIVVFSCDHGCGAWSIQPIGRTHTSSNRNGESHFRFSAGQAPAADTHCSHCGFKTHIAGPMWGGYLHNPFFIQRILDILPSLDREIYGTIPRIEGMLSTARDEMLLPEPLVKIENTSKNLGTTKAHPPETPLERLPPALQDRYPFFFMPSSLSKVLHCMAPSDASLRSALSSLGYRVTRSHAKAGSVRTDAPWNVIWEVMREWIRQKVPIKDGALKPGMPGYGVMRNDRSKGDLIAIREELSTIIHKADDVMDARNRLQALLCRFTDREPAGTAVSGEAAVVEEVKGDAPAAEHSKGQELNLGDINKLEIVFDEALGKIQESKKLVRYQANPRPDWGPQRRAKR